MSFPHPQAVRGEGIYIWDADGRRYIDASGGPVAVNIGHGVAEVARAVAEQTAAVAYVHGTLFTTPGLEAYSDALSRRVPLDDPRFYYLTSGSEAVEGAIKFARQVHVARGEPARDVVIARWGSYHGLSLGALAVTGKPSMRNLFAPLLRDQPTSRPRTVTAAPSERPTQPATWPARGRWRWKSAARGRSGWRPSSPNR
jgi:adenosylmethionine-8-amino-7-oxononanoate aminotransferase